MYNQGHQQGQNVFMNGGHGHQRYGMQMNSSKNYPSQQQQQQQQHQSQGAHHRNQHDHNGHGHASAYGAHHHNTSNSLPVRNGTPSHLQNGLNRPPPNDQWAHQLTLHQQSREATGTHPHARNHPAIRALASATNDPVRRDVDREERNRISEPMDTDQHSWTELDLGGQGLRALSPGLFNFTFLKKLHLSHNKLTHLHPDIGKLRGLTHLDLSANNLRNLPPELGMLVNLKTLYLFDNNIESLPFELGFLFQLDMLGMEGNPLHEDLKNILVEDGTRSLVTFLQESSEGPEPPLDRDWVVLDQGRSGTTDTNADKFTLLSYNILCDRAATRTLYGYTPPTMLSWDYRRDFILNECRAREPDILCLQEVDQGNYSEFFRPALAHDGYKGVYSPKSRARTMTDKEAKSVDGCATLFKNNKYILLDKQTIDFAKTAINRADMKSESDIFNRVMPRDNIAVVTFLENRQTGARLIVTNAHMHWDPAFEDVKLVQTAILLEQVAQIAQDYAKWPPCKDKKMFRYTDSDAPEGTESTPPEELPEPAPSQEYSSGTQIPLIVCGDYNSLQNSGVYELISNGSVSRDHRDLTGYSYGDFTRHGMAHPFSLKSSYDSSILPFTNYTPMFTGMIDYIFYGTNTLSLTGLLGEIEKSYLSKVPGFPNVHFPSDHIALVAEFNLKQKKERKPVEADFGPQSADRSASRH